MAIKTSQKIIDFIQKNDQVTAKQIVDYLDISYPGTYKQLNKLLEKNEIAKMGQPPTVYYYLQKDKEAKTETTIAPTDANIIRQTYLTISPRGEILEGTNGFSYWCQKNNLDIKKTAAEYSQTIKKYDQYKKDGLIDGLDKLKNTFATIYLDELYYFDFYSIERFGKTKLGTLLLYAKQSQNKKLMKNIYQLIEDGLIKLIKKKQIEAVCFIPPTVKRNIQLQQQLQVFFLHSSPTIYKPTRHIPLLKVIKISNEISVPQKSLTRLQDRIENVQSTMFIEDERIFNNILLIDDAVGSGATMNEIAKKIKNKKLCQGKIIGLALTGSFKGFDVIAEI